MLIFPPPKVEDELRTKHEWFGKGKEAGSVEITLQTGAPCPLWISNQGYGYHIPFTIVKRFFNFPPHFLCHSTMHIASFFFSFSHRQAVITNRCSGLDQG